MSPAAQAASADSIRAVLDRVFATPEYDWELRRHPLQFFLDWYRAVLTWLDELAFSHPVAYWVVIGLLVGILVATLAHFAYLVVRALRPRSMSGTAPSVVLTRFRDATWEVAEARRLALEGRFSEALAHRFVALVLELDKGGALRYHPSKTPGEYVNEARLGAAAAEEFRMLVAVFYGHLFGGARAASRPSQPSTVEPQHSWGNMWRPSSTVVLLAVFLVGVVVAALAGVRSAPTRALFDHRRSTYLTGPNGARALAQALESLGVTVEQRSRALFDFNADTAQVPELLALLDVDIFPTRVEQRVLADYVREGGRLFLAGWSGVERCFGLEVDYLRDSVPLAVDASLHLPQVEAVYAGLDEGLEKEKAEVDPSEDFPLCGMAQPVRVDTLLETGDDRVVAWRLAYDGGGSVLALADSRLLSNEVLKTTDAGIVVLPWLLRESGRRVVVDEYHQGFGEGGSIFLAAWDWTRRSPGGWVLLQLAFAGLVALGAGAVRFGPAMNSVSASEGRRRSVLEHLDALAVGLERAGGHEVAVRLIVGGLRRRLAGSRLAPQSESKDLRAWLESLSLAARTREAHGAVKRLGWLLRDRGGDPRVLETASTVEDLWEALRPTGRPERS